MKPADVKESTYVDFDVENNKFDDINAIIHIMQQSK